MSWRAAGLSTGRARCLGALACRRSARAARAARWQERHAPAAPIGCCRPHQGQVPGGCFQRKWRQALHRPAASLVRSPQSAHAPVISRDLA